MEASNPLRRQRCPNGLFPTLDGGCIDIQSEILRQRIESFSPHNKWQRMHPGGPIEAGNSRKLNEAEHLYGWR